MPWHGRTAGGISKPHKLCCPHSTLRPFSACSSVEGHASTSWLKHHLQAPAPPCIPPTRPLPLLFGTMSISTRSIRPTSMHPCAEAPPTPTPRPTHTHPLCSRCLTPCQSPRAPSGRPAGRGCRARASWTAPACGSEYQVGLPAFPRCTCGCELREPAGSNPRTVQGNPICTHYLQPDTAPSHSARPLLLLLHRLLAHPACAPGRSSHSTTAWSSWTPPSPHSSSSARCGRPRCRAQSSCARCPQIPALTCKGQGGEGGRVWVHEVLCGSLSRGWPFHAWAAQLL